MVKADIHTEIITALKQALLGVKERNRLVGHQDRVYGMAFSPDDQTIASASSDQTVILWNFQLEDLLIQGCNWVEDYLNNPKY